MEGRPGAERLAANILHLEGFASVDPQCPLGGPDGLKDILCEKDGVKYVGAAYFPTTDQRFDEIKNKFVHDLDGVAASKVDGLVFITNQALAPSERTSLIKLATDKNHKSAIYHLERIRSILDSPSGYGVRLEYLGLEMSREEQLSFFSQWNLSLSQQLKEQQRNVQEALTEMQADLRAIQSPLLPCGLLFTLRIHSNDEDLERVFGKQEGFRAFGPDKPLPPPPCGLPPGLNVGRLVSQNGYKEYRNGVLEAAGIFRMEHPGFNTIHCAARHTVCALDRNALREAIARNEPFCAPPSIKVEFFFAGKPRAPTTTPSLVLERGANGPIEVVSATALDNNIFVDFVVKELAVVMTEDTSWSSKRLKNSFVKFLLSFFYIERLSDLPEASWPTLHNLQIWLGGRARQVLTLSIEQLKEQLTQEDPNPIAGGQAKFV